MPERLQKAVDRVMFLNRDQGYMIPYAIGIVSKETGIDKSEIASAMAERRWQKKEAEDIKRTLGKKKERKQPPRASEKCRECGYDLSYREDQCPLCGVDTGWIFDISENIDEI